MNGFVDLDKEQSRMYRWIRETIPLTLVRCLAPKYATTVWSASPLEIDRILRTAFEEHEAESAADSINIRSRVRVGLLPEELGKALMDYTNAAYTCGVEGNSTDTNVALAEKLEALCNEMAKLRS